jgi:hypothetical protein
LLRDASAGVRAVAGAFGELANFGMVRVDKPGRTEIGRRIISRSLIFETAYLSHLLIVDNVCCVVVATRTGPGV